MIDLRWDEAGRLASGEGGYGCGRRIR